MKSEYKNFYLNVLYQILTFIFPLITIPYVSRVLGVENIGIYSYTNSVMYMFVLFGMLGINNYGNREIAKVRDNKNKLSEKFSEIYSLQFIANLISITSYLLYVNIFETEFIQIAYLQLIYLTSILFDVNWFYFGLEKFKLTITRNLIIKIISIVLIFSFVSEKNDLWIYVVTLGVSTLSSQLYLFFKLPKFVNFKKVSLPDILKHSKPVFLLFIPVISYGIYRVMDKIMIGTIAGIYELGYYENAEKLINIPIAINTALGTVMLPRMSYLLANKNDKVKNVLCDSMKLAMLLSCIMSVGLFFISNEVTILLFGTEFEHSGFIVKLLSITIIISAWANVIRSLLIIPLRKDSIYVYSTAGGAILNVIFNLFFITLWGAAGACIGTIVAETYVMIYQTIKSKDFIDISNYLKSFARFFFESLCIVGFAWFLSLFIENVFTKICSIILFSIIALCCLERKYIVGELLGFNSK